MKKQARRQTPVIYILLLLAIQLKILVLFILARYSSYSESLLKIAFCIGLTIIAVVTFCTVKVMVRIRNEAAEAAGRAFINDLMQVFSSLRGQRHDFIGHVQHMYTLLKNNDLQELQRYMKRTAQEIHLFSPGEHAIPASALETFLHARISTAIDHKIHYEYQIIPEVETIFPGKNSDLVRIIGNLLNNAFDEVIKLPAVQRFVRVYVDLDKRAGSREKELLITVTNTSRSLTEEEKQRMFTPGFSTKTDNHSGLGLPIVQKLVHQYGGRLEVCQQPEQRISFIIRLPSSWGAAG
ncbi:sensor histidine kinase [Paenibacillus tarimensis]|uniref:sensor histidine kinase n=1 Tax=Paenibacillus tarimensis TaxID=416012 RepID=UPI001F2F4C74|nr:ATP-binding protein [Paenibacillus tarimensis]MCF2943885.1 ATP-binding protein [Paenibacillus tarimensis]